MPNYRPKFLTLGTFLLVFALSACTRESPPVKGFVLPEGDIAKGEQVFVKYNCYACHTITGVDLPVIEPAPPMVMPIGGEVYRVKNYGELLTAVINPSHVVSPEYIAKLEEAQQANAETLMPYYGDAMTITEMVDLVAFLQAQYSQLMPEFFQSYAPEN